MATATAMGDCDGNSNGDGDGNGNKVGNGDGDGDGNGNGNGHGKGDHYKVRVASSCGGNVQCFLEGRHLASTPMDTNKKCILHGGDSAKSFFLPFKGEGS